MNIKYTTGNVNLSVLPSVSLAEVFFFTSSLLTRLTCTHRSLAAKTRYRTLMGQVKIKIKAPLDTEKWAKVSTCAAKSEMNQQMNVTGAMTHIR